MWLKDKTHSEDDYVTIMHQAKKFFFGQQDCWLSVDTTGIDNCERQQQ